MPKQHLTTEILAAAIDGFEAQKKRIDAQIAEIRQMLDGSRPEPAAEPAPTKRRRKMSAAARKRIAVAQRKRWAAVRGESGASRPVPAQAPKRKRRLSAAGRKRIIEATKKRWAAVRAAKRATAPARTKAARRKSAATKAA